MLTSMQVSKDVSVAPLRSLDDFCLSTARFQLPQLADLDKWNRRVVSNLLYYQTNYFLMAILIFLLFGFYNPSQMLLGIVAMLIAISIFVYANASSPAFTEFKTNHPMISLLLIFGGGYVIVYLFSSVVVFLLGILLPTVLVLLHASLRQRNLRNKIANKLEATGLSRTPMGMLLASFGSDVYEVFY